MKLSQNGNANVRSYEGPLSPTEIQNAEGHWLKFAQLDLVKRLKKGEFKTLTAFLDVKGIIRVGGRVNLRLFSYDNTHPALLPRKHWISTLVTRHSH